MEAEYILASFVMVAIIVLPVGLLIATAAAESDDEE